MMMMMVRSMSRVALIEETANHRYSCSLRAVGP